MPVSRILSPASSRRAGGQSSLSDGSCLPPQAANPECNGRATLSLSGLAPGGVYRGQPVTRLPVSSYLTISPLPQTRRYVSVALSLGSPPLAVSQRPALWSSDFPRRRHAPTRLPGML